jgi:excisionase family DNA binding protein
LGKGLDTIRSRLGKKDKDLKAELTFPLELIDDIADKVIERLSPMLCSNDEHEDIIFDVEGVAQYLKVKKQWVYERVHYNTIPHFKMGKYPRFRKSDIDQWLEKMKRGKGSQTTKTVRRLLDAPS